MFQSGLTDIPADALFVEVVFDVPFYAVPSVIIPVVQSVGASGIQYIIEAGVTDKSTTGFTVWFDVPPPTDEYKLAWVAGDSDVIEMLNALSGRKLTSFSPAATMRRSFKIPFIFLSPTPHIELVDNATFDAGVVRKLPQVPAGPLEDIGLPMDMYSDDNWLYVRISDRVARIPLDNTTSWSLQPFYVPFREAEVTIVPSTGVRTFRIDYSTPFADGNVPKPLITLSDEGSVDVEMVNALVTARDLSGFNVTFNSPPNSTTLKVYYMARQLS